MIEGIKIFIVIFISFGLIIGSGIYLEMTDYNEKKLQERIDNAKIVCGKIDRISYQGGGTGETKTTSIHFDDGRIFIVKNYQRNLEENQTYKLWIDENPHFDCYDLLKYERKYGDIDG